VVRAAALEMTMNPLPADQVVSGSPRTGAAAIPAVGGLDAGV
jgi:hypothetical protein